MLNAWMLFLFQWECLWFLILSLTFFLTLSWFYFWWEVHNDYDEFNWFVYNRTGYWSDWSIPVLVTTAAGFTYIAFLLVLALCHITVGQQMNLHWLHKIGVTATLVATVVAIISIDQLWKEEWNILFISFQATAPFLHVGGVVAITLLAWLVAGQFARAERASFQVVLCIAYLSVVLALYLVPLTISSPCIMLKKDLGSRPAIFGHRGAPMMAPENTLMSFQKAIENKADGVQTDVSLSHDGVPFLMHDNLLRRTTNVDEKFSERASVHSSMFNWTDLEQLNAGEWFTTNDPFWTVHSLSASDSAKAANQSVCRLDDLLSLAKASNISVILNLQDLPVEHPYNNNFINITLETIMNSGILQHMVVWLHDKDRQLVRQISPDFQQASESKREVSALIADGIFSLYLRYSQINVKEVREYTSRNLSTILYTVNEPWLYSVLWCAGVKSVTSDASHILKQVPSPIWLMVCSSKQSELQKRIFY
ncbi:glycerophosphodiester phosphodiesterase domain-containing protein 5 isoform X2 [Protopterus annectens]|uniref:glycerophosphodiester phosphodiesterase domain-containing protein 5 isoform X2 n=1 Tax=Protopterus annectens TaxID=7888 RepID=UPI001CFBFC91|nr:glycerophosphodiester phosphodiesterase domain-containing protein 5 isoform X2 [Protopterus annectens]